MHSSDYYYNAIMVIGVHGATTMSVVAHGTKTR